MDVTNPGLVNVADQSCGNPSTTVQSLTIPEDSDVLVPVANQGNPRAEDVTSTKDGGVSTGPIPTTTSTMNQPPASPSQSFAQLPGVAPAFAPFPQEKIVNTVDGQQASQNQIQPASFDVIGVTDTVQTNQTADTHKQYKVTSVVDADTGGPVVDPSPPIPNPPGNFVGVYAGDSSHIIVLSGTAFDFRIVDGLIVSLVSTDNPAYNFPQTISNRQQFGPVSFDYASKGNPSGTIVTLSSTVPWIPGTLIPGLPLTISGSGLYDGPNVAQNVISLIGSFDEIDAAGPGHITVVSHLPTALVDGNLVCLWGPYIAAGPQPASKIVNDSDTILSIVDNGGKIRVASTHALSANFIANGQMVTISTPNYSGTYAVSNITGGAFDLDVAWTVDEIPSAGSWTSYTFNLPISWTSSYANDWTCSTFDISFPTATYTGTAAGNWQSYTFRLQGAYSGPGTGTYTHTPPFITTTRYKMFVTPQNLLGFGVSMLGREITFGEATATPADRGATRFISYYGNNYVVIDKNKPTDQVNPILTDPQQNDIFSLDVQRQAGEVTTENLGTSQDVTIAPSPLRDVPNFGLPPVAPGMPNMGPIEISTGPQPGAPIITGGVQVPTAINVNVADQATSVGLPANIYV
jgi:hypothetical protein